MEKLVEFLFKVDPSSQFDGDSQLTSVREERPKGSSTYTSAQTIESDCLTYASTSFSVIKVTQVKKTVRQTKLVFPSQKVDPRSHLAQVDEIYIVGEWSDLWLNEKDCEIACKLLCFDGYDFYKGSIPASDCAQNRQTIYRVIAGYAVGAIASFASINSDQSELIIKAQSKNVVHLILTKSSSANYSSAPQSSESGSNEFGSIIALAAKQQIVSWSMTAKLLDNLTHLHAAVNEVEAAADRVAKKIQADRSTILMAATKLINTKKAEIKRLQTELEAHSSSKLSSVIGPAAATAPPEPAATVTSPRPKSKSRAKAKTKARVAKKKAKAISKRTPREGPNSPEGEIASDVQQESDHPTKSEDSVVDAFAGFDDDSDD